MDSTDNSTNNNTPVSSGNNIASDKTTESNSEYNVLTIDRPEQWEPAGSMQVKFRTKDTGIVIPMSCISLEAWDSIMNQFPIREADEADMTREENRAYQQERDAIYNKRVVALVEACTQFKFPGDTPEKKIASASTILEEGFLNAMGSFINDFAAGAQEGSLLPSYESSLQKRETIVGSIDELAKVLTHTRAFRMQRPFENRIIQIMLRPISAAVKKQIDTDCPLPEPPLMPQRIPGGGFDVRNMLPNYNDPRYVASMQAASKRRLVLYLRHCLPFEIPGLTIEEQSSWLGERLVGDIRKLKHFIENTMLSSRGRYDFLSALSCQKS